MPANVTLGEVVRRLDALTSRVETMISTLEQRYVPKDLAEAQAANLLARISDNSAEIERLERRIDKQDSDVATNRRLVFSALIAPVLVALIVAVILGAGLGH